MVVERQAGQLPYAATFLALTVVVIIVLAGVTYYRYAATPPEEAIVFSDASFFPVKSVRLPAVDTPGWKPVSLPHDWQKSGEPGREGWYTMEIDFKVPPNRLWGMYIPRVTSNVLAYVNGEVVGRGGRFRDPVARNGNRPLYFSIPNSFLVKGSNRVFLRVKAAEGKAGYLGPVYLGPDESLRPVFQRFYKIRVNVVEIITASLVLVAVLMLGLWSVRRRDSLAFWFALICLAWAVHNLNLLVVEVPVSTRVWECVRYLSVGWFAVLLVFFMNCMLGLHEKRVEYTITSVMLTGSIALCVIEDTDTFFSFANHYWLPLALLIGSYTAVRIPYAWWKSWNIEYFIAMCAGFPILPVTLHDWMQLNGYISREHGMLMQYSAVTVLLGFTIILLIRYSRALNESEEWMHTLEARVEEKGKELELNYQRLRKLEQDKVLGSERERIMRDMHDGVGGHLVSALAMTESKSLEPETFRELLGSALMDLRLMIDSLDQTEGDLTAVLGMLRARLQPALEESGISVRWEVRDIPVIPDLGPSRVLQIMRILQEAITNVIKHSRADILSVETGETADSVFIEIRDDGVGIPEINKEGRGLRNMQYRASRAGIGFVIRNTERGTSVKLDVPLKPGNPQ